MAQRLHGGDARKYVRVAQMAGIALGVTAAALWALEVPGLAYRDPARPRLPEQQPIIAADRQEPRFDRERGMDTAERLELGRKRAPSPAQEPSRTAQEPPRPAPASGPAITYIGPIYEATRTLAVISIEGRQRIVPEGRSIGDARIVSISGDRIEIQDQSGRRSIPRGERSGVAVSWLRNMPTSTPVVATNAMGGRAVVRGPGGRAESARGAANGFSPEMEQRFRERGIDPAQAQRWREALRERQAARGGESGGALNPTDAADGLTDPEKILHDQDEIIHIETNEKGEETVTRLKRLREEGLLPEDGEIRP